MTKEIKVFDTLDQELKDQLICLKAQGIFLVKATDFIDESEDYYIIDRNTKETKLVWWLNEAFVVLWEKMETLFNN